MYQRLFVAGTFDHFHAGHESLLRTAFEQGKEVTIGITSDTFVHTNKPRADIQPFAIRKLQVDAWLQKQKYSTAYHIISIEDRYEPAVSGNYDALIVTSQNKQTGVEINTKRKNNLLQPLQLIEVPLIPAYDTHPISSTRIRSGEIDTLGNLYLPESLRTTLQQPFGPIVQPDSLENLSGKIVISVGDITTEMLLHKGIVPDLSIIDLYAQRKPYKTLDKYSFPDTAIIYHISSGPGYISREAINVVKSWSIKQKQTVIIISGEDDLLVLPVILFAPEGAYVFYGQPNEGLVKVIVNEELKLKGQEYLKQFISSE